MFVPIRTKEGGESNVTVKVHSRELFEITEVVLLKIGATGLYLNTKVTFNMSRDSKNSSF